MFKIQLVFTAGVLLYAPLLLNALTLKESVVEAINTNPVVQERLKNYRLTQQDLNIAESEYYPSLDLSAAIGYNNAGDLKTGSDSDWSHNVLDQNYGNYETQLKLTQNLFDGFGTMHKVDYQEARILAAAYNYIEKSNDIAFKMTNVYLKVLSEYELLQTARENVQINEDIFNKVKALFDAGLTTESEVTYIESTLSLARSNLTVQKNNTRDAEFSFRRILGRMPDVTTMVKPDFDVPMPESLERAALYSINHNPSLLVSRYNIKGAQSLWKQHQKEFYPTVDLEVSQTYNDVQTINSYDRADDRFKARLVMNYNIFRGGADDATVQKDISKINQEVEIKRDLKRQVIEGLDLSWNAYKMIDLQLKDLKDYSVFSERTLGLYKEEYDLGRRSLLDLLSAQKNVINSRSQIISAEYDKLFAKYRILDAMGLLPLAVVGDTKEFTTRVNLYSDSAASEVLDTLPVKYDVDNDNIADNEDLCDNSLIEDKIMPYGCRQMTRDSDGDGVIDSKDKCPLTPKNAKVTPDGCAIDSDFDGVIDYADECLQTPLGDEVDVKGCSIITADGDSDEDGVLDSVDKCPNSPLSYDVDADGCTEKVTVNINFADKSTKIPESESLKIDVFANYLRENPDFNAKIIGYSSRTPISDDVYNLKLSKDRARAFKQALINGGIDPKRLTSTGRGFHNPIADNSTEMGRKINRRVEIELTRKGE